MRRVGGGGGAGLKSTTPTLQGISLTGLLVLLSQMLGIMACIKLKGVIVDNTKASGNELVLYMFSSLTSKNKKISSI